MGIPFSSLVMDLRQTWDPTACDQWQLPHLDPLLAKGTVRESSSLLGNWWSLQVSILCLRSEGLYCRWPLGTVWETAVAKLLPQEHKQASLTLRSCIKQGEPGSLEILQLRLETGAACLLLLLIIIVLGQGFLFQGLMCYIPGPFYFRQGINK